MASEFDRPCSVFEYTYLLFWNSFWTILPVIAMGLFDRIVDDHVLMDLPELYKHARNGEYFNLKLFLIYVLDASYQVSTTLARSMHKLTRRVVCDHILLYAVCVPVPDVSSGWI